MPLPDRPSVDVLKARPPKDGPLQQRPSVAECVRRADPPKVPEVPLKPAYADPRQPRFPSSPLPSRRAHPPPLPPAGVSKVLRGRPALGSGGFLHSGLMSELNSVLSKSGRRPAEEGEEKL